MGTGGTYATVGQFPQFAEGDSYSPHGNLIADLRNFMLDFAYARFDKVGFGWFDTFTSTYSFNSQREERVRPEARRAPDL